MNDTPEDLRQLDECISCKGDMYTESSFSMCDECRARTDEEKELLQEGLWTKL